MINIFFCIAVCLLSIALMLGKDKLKALAKKLTRGKKNKQESKDLGFYQEIREVLNNGVNVFNGASYTFINSDVTIKSSNEIELPIVYERFESFHIGETPALKVYGKNQLEYHISLSRKLSFENEDLTFVQLAALLTSKKILRK